MTKAKSKIKLSIIITYYNNGDYTKEILDVLDPQVRDDIEVMVIDDGSRIPFETAYKWCKVVRQKNGGVSIARNTGIDRARGDYISFIDGDDCIPEYYVEKILEKTKETNADVIDFSWRSYDNRGAHHIILKTDDDYLENPAVWCRCLKRDFIGLNRFNVLKDSTEDEDFSRKLGYMQPGNYKHVVISDYMYYYRDMLPGSKHNIFRMGLLNTKKVCYYFQHVTKEMTWLLDEIKKEDELNEVWLFTKQNDIPELSRYCRITTPHRTWTHIARGERFDQFDIERPALKCQICIYTKEASMVCGITTFIYNFCKVMNKYYDIVFLHGAVDPQRLDLIRTVARCIKYNPNIKVLCDALLIQRINDEIPQNVIADQTIQMIHCLRLPNNKIRDNVSHQVIVSQAAKDSWGEMAEKAIVINNFAEPQVKQSLLLVSATRVDAFDKGDNDNRMFKLANMLNYKGIPFVWLLFGSKAVDDLPRNMYNMKPIPNVGDFIAKADYLVQLSDESFSYTVLEALQRGTAVLVKNFGALKELGFKDKEMGYILPDDMDFDVEKLLKVPQFAFKYDNDKVVHQWRELIGDKEPTAGFYGGEVKVRALISFYDIKQKRDISKGEEYTVTRARADELAYGFGYVTIV